MVIAILPGFAENDRPAGEDFFGETAARLSAERYLRDAGLSFQRRSLLSERGGFGVSLHIDIPARSPAPEKGTLVVAAPLSSSGGEPDFAVRAALAFAARVASSGAPMDVRVALLADEYSQLPPDLRGRTNLGLRDLVDRYDESERTAVIYLDLRELRGAATILHGSARTVAPLGVLVPLLEAFGKRSLPLSVKVPFNELYRLGLLHGPASLALLQERGFPALSIEADPRSDGTGPSPQSADRFAEGLYDYALSLGSIPEAADRRYFLFSLGRSIVPLGEGVLVALFALTTALGFAALLAYSLIHRHLLLARGKVFLRRSWVLPLFLLVLFLCLLASGAAVSLAVRAFGGNADLPTYGAAALKFAFALALYFIASSVLTLLPVPKRTHFYSSAATLLFAGACFLAAGLDFTFVPIFLWGFSCALVASILRSPSASFALAVLTPLQILAAAAGAIGSGEDGPARILLSADIRLNLFFAFAVLPFLLLFSRVAGLARSGAGPSQLAISRYSRIIFFAGTLFSTVSYAANIGKVESSESPPLRERVVSGGSSGSPLELRLASTTFLDRRTLRLTLRPEGTPVRIDLSVESEKGLSIYDAPVPYVLSEDGRKASFTLGERPALPLVLELTLPFSSEGMLHAAALYTSPLDTGRPKGTEDYVLTVEASLPFGETK